jgi:hypothetical protein
MGQALSVLPVRLLRQVLRYRIGVSGGSSKSFLFEPLGSILRRTKK